MQCVCGASVWNNAKTKQIISEARDCSQLKVVSASDETFALLLLIYNYLVKWKTRAGEDGNASIDPEGHGAAAIFTEGQNAAAIITEGEKIRRIMQTKTAA